VIDVATNTIVDAVPVGTGPLGIAITPDGSRAYVANFGSITSPNIPGPGNTVSVINATINLLLDEVDVGFGPAGVAITPDGSKVLVSNFDSDGIDPGNTVSVIDTGTNPTISTITVGNRPFGIAVTHDGTKAYVANYFSDTLSVIDVLTNSVLATISVDGGG
jgi:YVTN family beta-propeller protein